MHVKISQKCKPSSRREELRNEPDALSRPDTAERKIHVSYQTMGLRKSKLSLIIFRKVTANQHAALPSTGSMDARSVIELGSLEKAWWDKKQIISPPAAFSTFIIFQGFPL